MGTCASPSRPSIGTFLLFWKRGGRLRRRSGVLRRLPSSRLALIRIRRMTYRVCRRRSRGAVRAGRVAPWSRLTVFTRASAPTWSWRVLDVGPKLGRRLSSPSFLRSIQWGLDFAFGMCCGGFVCNTCFRQLSGPSVSPCKCDALALHPGDSHPRAHTLSQATVVDWQLDLGRPWDLSRLERQLWPHPPTRSR